jgi:hypothetical protein
MPDYGVAVTDAVDRAVAAGSASNARVVVGHDYDH